MKKRTVKQFKKSVAALMAVSVAASNMGLSAAAVTSFPPIAPAQGNMGAVAYAGGASSSSDVFSWLSSDKEKNGTHYIVEYYLDGALASSMTVDDYLTSGGTTVNFARDLTSGKNDYTFIGYTVTAGHDSADQSDDNKLTIAFDQNIHLVRAIAFYQSVPETVTGTSYGAKFPAGYDKETDVMDIDGERTYNTDQGLHTDKSIKNSGTDGREFELTLEAWYAGQNQASVGYMLDASGSMAYTSMEPTPINLNDLPDGPVKTAIANTDPYTVFDTSKIDINQILNPRFTDNSQLGYGGYTYFIYRGDQNEEEYSPLGYWDGRTKSVAAAEDAAISKLSAIGDLIGFYPFNGSLDNMASDNGGKAKLVYWNTSAYGNELDLSVTPSQNSSGAWSYSTKSKTEFTGINENVTDNAVYKDNMLNLTALMNGDTKASVLLDAVPTDKDSFTISVSTVRDGINSHGRGNEVTNDNGSYSIDMERANHITDILFIGGKTNGSSRDFYSISHVNGGGHGRLVVGNKDTVMTQAARGGLLNMQKPDGSGSAIIFDVVGKQTFTFVFDKTQTGDSESGTGNYAGNNGRDTTNYKIAVYRGDELVANNLFDTQGNQTGDTTSLSGISDLGIFLGGYINEFYRHEKGKDGADANEEIYIDEVAVFDKPLTTAQVGEVISALPAVNTSSGDLTDPLDYTADKSGAYIASGNYKKNADLRNNYKAGWYFAGSSRGSSIRTGTDNVYSLGTAKNLLGVDKYPSQNASDFGTNKEENAVRHGSLNNESGAIGRVNSLVAGLINDANANDSSYTYEPAVAGNDYDAVGNPPIIFKNGYTDQDFGPVAFYKDVNNYLWCVYCTSISNSPKNRTSPVFMKADSDTVKSEELQSAIGNFGTLLDLHSSNSEMGAVRFSAPDFADALDELHMLTWTDDPVEMVKMLGLTRNDYGANLIQGYETDDDGVNRYNYFLTGGTNTVTAFDAFNQILVQENEPKASSAKYIILFTDGLDTSYSNVKNDSSQLDEFKAWLSGGVATAYTGSNADIKKLESMINTAKSFKAHGFTIYCMLMSGGTPRNQDEADVSYRDDALAFLSLVAGNKDTDAKIFPNNGSGATADADTRGKILTAQDANHTRPYVIATTAANLNEVMQESVIKDIDTNPPHYVIQDYLDPRFNIYSKYDNSLITLGPDGEITVGGKTETLTETKGYDMNYGKALENTVEKVDNKNRVYDEPILYYNGSNGMYFIQWREQRLNGCEPGATSLDVWKETIKIRAKEDFLGGYAVLTNGNAAGENMAFYDGAVSADKTSVGITKSSDTSNAEHLYFEDSDGAATQAPSKGFPRTAADVATLVPALQEGGTVLYMGEIITPTDLLDGMKVKNNDEAALYWEYLERYAKKNGLELLDILNKIMTTGYTVDYSYLPSYDAEDKLLNHTGTSDHEDDVIGTLTYTWTPADQDMSGSADTNKRTYTLKVTYEPSDKKDQRKDSNTALIVDKASGSTVYDWKDGMEDKYAKPTVADREAEDEYIVNYVSGAIAVQMKIAKSDAAAYKGKFTYTADLERTYNNTTATVGKYTAELDTNDLTAAETDGDYYVVTAVFTPESDYADMINGYGLPIGDYKLTNESKTAPVGFVFDDTKSVNIGNDDEDLFEMKWKTNDDPAESASAYAAPRGNDSDDDAPEWKLGTIDPNTGYLDHLLGLAVVTGFVNSDTWKPSVTKDLQGRDWESDDEFTFVIAADDNYTANAYKNGTFTYSDPDAKDAGNGTTFKYEVTVTDGTSKALGTFTFYEAGTYKFMVKELPGSIDGMTYSEVEYYVTVTVTAGSDGTLSVETPAAVAAKNPANGEKYDNDNFTFVNVYTPDPDAEVIDLTVTKEWKNDSASLRPDSITVNLLQGMNGNAPSKISEATLTAAGGWKHTFKDLPKADALGTRYEYSVEEVIDVTLGYSESISETANGFMITNTYKAQPPVEEPPQTEPPQTEPPQTEPPQTEPPMIPAYPAPIPPSNHPASTDWTPVAPIYPATMADEDAEEVSVGAGMNEDPTAERNSIGIITAAAVMLLAALAAPLATGIRKRKTK